MKFSWKTCLSLCFIVIFCAVLVHFGSSEATAAEKTYVIKYAHPSPEKHHQHLSLLEMQKYVAEKSQGRLVMEIYPNGQLGSDRQAIEAVQLGTIQMTISASAPFASFSKASLIFDLPYLFKSAEQAYQILDGPLGTEILEELSSKGLKALGYGLNGFRNISNNKLPITKPEDLKGVKVRTMENPIHLATFKKLGAIPTPMAIGEVYTALQQGVVDGEENPLSLIHTYRFYEVQKYVSLTRHFFQPQIEVINMTFWNNLPEDLQKILKEATILRRDVQRKIFDEHEAEAYKVIATKCAINELSAEEIKLFRDAVIDVYKEFEKDIGAERLQKFLDATE